MTTNKIIAVDGTAGAGKGTLAKLLAEKLGLPYMDTGKLYRAVGAITLQTGRDPVEVAQHLCPQDLERDDLRTPAVTKMASDVAKNPKVRQALVSTQRDFAQQKGAVLDGRDIGTVIFPHASVKFFLVASPKVRAQRRFLQEGGEPDSADAKAAIARIEKAISQRDAQDEERQAAPLKPAKDAHIIDTDNLTIAQVEQHALTLAKQAFAHS